MVIDLSLFFAIVHESWSLRELSRVERRENWNVNKKLHFYHYLYSSDWIQQYLSISILHSLQSFSQMWLIPSVLTHCTTRSPVSLFRVLICLLFYLWLKVRRFAEEKLPYLFIIKGIIQTLFSKLCLLRNSRVNELLHKLSILCIPLTVNYSHR